MADVDLISSETGKLISVSPTMAESMVKGGFARPLTAEEDAREAARQAETEIAAEDAAAEREKYDNPLLAFGSAFGRGLTGHLIDPLLPKDVLAGAKKLEEHNPIFDAAGDIGSLFVPFGAPAKALGLATRVGGRLAERLGGKLLAKTAGAAVSGGIEGGAMSAMQTVEDLAFGEKITPEETAKRALASVGVGSVANLAALGLGGIGKKIRKGMLGEDDVVMAHTAKQADVKSDQAYVQKLSPEAKAAVEELKTATDNLTEAQRAGKNWADEYETKGLATPAQKARLRVRLEDPRLPAEGSYKTKLGEAVANERLTAREVAGLENQYRRSVQKSWIPPPKIQPKGMRQEIEKLRNYGSHPKTADDVKTAMRELLDTPELLTKERALPLIDQAEEQLGRKAYEAEEIAKRQALLGAKDDLKASATDAVKEAKAAYETAKAKVEAQLGGWKPKSGVSIEDLDDEAASIAQRISATREAAFERQGQLLKKYKSFVAPIGGAIGLGYGGMDFASFLFGSVGGTAVTAVLGSKLGRKMQVGALKATLGVAPAMFKAAKYSAIKMLNDSDVDEIAQRVEYVQPEDVQLEAETAYSRVGLEPEESAQLATIQAKRVDLIKRNLPKKTTDVPRFSELYAAVSYPPGIAARIAEDQSTVADLVALREMMPSVYQQLKHASEYALKEKRHLSQSTRQQLEMIVSPEKYLSEAKKMQALIATPSQGATPPQPPRPTGAAMKPPLLPMQRLQAMASGERR